jgi:CxxC-x17-CxxC domain-containing protein
MSLSMSSEIVLKCRDCDASFTFSDDERTSFAALGHTHAPSRCADCRSARKVRQEETGQRQVAPGFRENHQPRTAVVCSTCGMPATVPFAVRRDRPVYCSSCFQRRRTSVDET